MSAAASGAPAADKLQISFCARVRALLRYFRAASICTRTKFKSKRCTRQIAIFAPHHRRRRR